MMKIGTFGFVPFIYAGTQQSPLLDVALRILGVGQAYACVQLYTNVEKARHPWSILSLIFHFTSQPYQ